MNALYNLNALQLLQQYWGYSSFRPQQKEIIDSLLDGRDTIGLLPTGGGKSLCFQIPALAKDGFCLVVSPLIALMQDQVKRLAAHGIKAACLYAGMTRQEVINTLEHAANGQYKLLYVSPERVQTGLFLEYLPSFALNLIAVDEAHCISQWGHDFRPEYLKIAQLKKTFPHTPILALTASATKDVESDILQQLRLFKPKIFRQSFARHNIFYSILYAENKWTALLEVLKKHQSFSCIIYCRSRRQTEVLMRQLNEHGFSANNYHAGMNSEKREKNADAWMNNIVQIMVATTAFGMGIDKPDVRLVIHFDAPEHIEAYYQEAGRAGRDNKPSEAVLLYNTGDLNRLNESTSLLFPSEDILRKTYQAICEYLQLPIGAQPNRYFDFELTDFCKKFSLPILQTTHVLRLLAQDGLWTFTDNVFHQATVVFIVDRYVLDNIYNQYPHLGMVCISLLRLYGYISYHPTSITLHNVAKQARMNENEVEQSLYQLQEMGVLEYQKPKDGPQLFFQHQRADSRHLIINHQRIEWLRQRHLLRTEAMVYFLKNKETCIEKTILNYFGEQTDVDCTHCNICLEKDSELLTNKDIAQVIFEQLAVRRMSLQQIVKKFPTHQKELVITCLRSLLDNNKISLSSDGMVSLN